jgi:hypothetical protein
MARSGHRVCPGRNSRTPRGSSTRGVAPASRAASLADLIISASGHSERTDTHLSALDHRPAPVDLSGRDPALAALANALQDDLSVVVELYADLGDGISLDLGVRGDEGLRRFLGLLRAIESDLGTDDDGLMVTVGPEWEGPAATLGGVNGAFPDWAFLTLNVQEPSGGMSPPPGPLHTVTETARVYRDTVTKASTSATSPRSALRVIDEPAPAPIGHVPAELRPLVAALTTPDAVVVLDASRIENRSTITVAVRGAFGMRCLSALLKKINDETGPAKHGLMLDAELRWEASDPGRPDLDGYPDWLPVSIRLDPYSSERASLEELLLEAARVLFDGPRMISPRLD